MVSSRVNSESSGFGYAVDPQTTRRQLALSVTLVAILAVAIITTLSLTAPPAGDRNVAVAVSIVTQRQAANRSLTLNEGS